MRTLIIDTETTDLVQNSLIANNLQPEVIELYGCVLNDEGNMIDEIEFLCKPRQPISELITKITRITNADLASCPSFSHFAPKLRDMIESCSTVVAHNLSFDMAVLEFEFARIDHEIIRWPERRICTVESTEWLNGYRLKLSELHEVLFGVGFADAHRAKADVQALARIFVELRRLEYV